MRSNVPAEAIHRASVQALVAGEIDDAEALARFLCEVLRDAAGCRLTLSSVALRMGDAKQAMTMAERALALNPRSPDVWAACLRGALFAEHTPPAHAREVAQRWAARFLPKSEAAPVIRTSPNGPIRIGLVSPYFRRNALAIFLEPLLRALRQVGGLELVAFADVGAPDDTTHRLEGLCDGWHTTAGMTDEAVAELVRSQQLDVLVDLTGHQNGSRLGVFALRPAPVLVSWAGYAGPTGLTGMHRITDATVDPAGFDALYTEQLVRLPRCFMPFAPHVDLPAEVSPLPATSMGYVTFGACHQTSKLSPRTLRAWADVMRRTPRSRLLLNRECYSAEPVRRRVLDRLIAHGIAADRVDFSHLADRAGHLAAHDWIDIELDSFAFSGTTTTCEALWCGVPVVTMAGDRPWARVGASILRAADLSELVANSAEQFADVAVGLASDIERLADLRASMRTKLQASELCDVDGFARAWLDAIRQLRDAACGGEDGAS